MNTYIATCQRVLWLFFCLSALPLGNLPCAAAIDVIPQPNHVEEEKGVFDWSEPINVKTKGVKTSFRHFVISHLKELDAPVSTRGFFLKNRRKLLMERTSSASVNLSPEAYELEIGKDIIRLSATDESGLWYGLQTLIQLRERTSRIPACKIKDAPRFPFRSFMIDVSRHFFDIPFLKKQIDVLSQLKFNHLQLHLTDAAGWRMEIKKYPRLTQVGAFRSERLWKKWWNGGRKYVNADVAGAYGGYYTQKDLKELVRYAKERGITIIPEIEMPGHSEEVLTAYPELSCTHEPYKQADYCAGNERVFSFLYDVLTEVMEVFPSEYIHIGGDEARKQSWGGCPLCLKRMKDENLSTLNELQSYFIHRIDSFLTSRGRRLLGWDEILEGGLSPHATVASWRGEGGALQASKSGHHAIMVPGEYLYFDSYQDAPLTQPEAIGGYTPLKKVYGYDPLGNISDTAIAENVIGVQANMWTEYIPDENHAEYMMYPRALALAEIGWTQKTQKDFADFRRRALGFLDDMTRKNYHPFNLRSEVGDRKESQSIRKHLAFGKKVTYGDSATYHPRYTAGGDTALTDGWRGNWSYQDKRWQGLIDRNRLNVTIDLEKEEEIHYIGADFLQMAAPDVFFPSEVTISVSNDGVGFTELSHISHRVSKEKPIGYQTFYWQGYAKARYVKYAARSGKHGGFLFTDEIVVE